jgi:hypothetical protein
LAAFYGEQGKQSLTWRKYQAAGRSRNRDRYLRLINEAGNRRA